MSQASKIEWTDTTWNPIRGCTPVSPGCKNCYASNLAKRFSGPGRPYEGLVRINAAGKATNEWSGVVRFIPEHLLDPFKLKPIPTGCDPERNRGPRRQVFVAGVESEGPAFRPHNVFVNSMSDLFHVGLQFHELVQIFAVMALNPQCNFQVLTKRPELMARFLSQVDLDSIIGFAAWEILEKRNKITSEQSAIATELRQGNGNHVKGGVWPLPNVILGTSVENNEWAAKRRDALAAVSAAGWRTMVSYEPALGPVDWQGQDWSFLNWLIAGGETQTGSRASHPDSFRSARDFCIAHEIPFFFKQWGDWAPTTDPSVAAARGLALSDCMSYAGKKAAGALLDGREWREMPLLNQVEIVTSVGVKFTTGGL